ncbi:hypothetical protein D1BOALGB6SA_4935 [Olavius sp. associated proteobacterium Delta 1]|nr:hypothetical protein D1BOALGB6SA_4935 [Olavius sp. associated proteobacterium Delta 1]
MKGKSEELNKKFILMDLNKMVTYYRCHWYKSAPVELAWN